MKEQRIVELFVSEEESSVLEKIAVGEAPFSQRAQAILAVDAGSNQEQAASVAGLRVTQVRYWISRFNNSRLTIFPEAMLAKIEEQQGLESGAETKRKKMEKAKESKSKKKSKNVKSKAKNKEKQDKKKKGGKKKAALTKPQKEKKKKKESKGKPAKKGKKAKKQKKNK